MSFGNAKICRLVITIIANWGSCPGNTTLDSKTNGVRRQLVLLDDVSDALESLEVEFLCSSKSLLCRDAIDCADTCHCKWVTVECTEVSHLVIGNKVHVLLLAAKGSEWKSSTN